MLALSIGVRKAARQLGLKHNTVLSWSKRDKWFADPQKPSTIAKQNGNAISAIKSPSNALADTLREHSQETKLGLSTAARRAAVYAARMTPVRVIRSSRGLKNVTEIAEKVHGWNAQSRITSVFAQQAVVITDEEIDELQARLRRLRGEE